ncbi:Endonuclease/Exonuclease/phosphatase family protein [Posidoniimonas polymericola]|uniref:Endonuclease/Exonuclease/phosphatase family protein n=1 Tax=Posidoniimonas polymericola TaxID=2528002 RepID=A0A5C5YTD7_9BACT|nr:endonuclease/exonuclease/phosphatase family protein [Posidoniimonas polymericola]TWT78264.1 Endonuclease/Exonuclease/phosphatase family protein [Posidoniimonas polymericola]
MKRTLRYAAFLLTLGVDMFLSSPRVFASTFVDRFLETDLRVATYNVFFDANFSPNARTDPETPERFARVVNALDADVLNLQEIYNHSAQDVFELMSAVAPLPDGQQWHTHQYSDNVIVSRYPFKSVSGRNGWAEALIDLPDQHYDVDLFIMNDHYACCNNEYSRQLSADRMIAHLQDLRTPGGRVDLPTQTPILILGDLNIVRSGRPLETLLNGGVVYEGQDSPPDWDGTSLANALPLHNGVGPENYTWRDDSDVFDPGVLDFVLYTDSVLTTANKFVLNSTTMSATDLAATGLQPNDVFVRVDRGFYDHLPVVVDFRSTAVPEPNAVLLLVVGLAFRFNLERSNRSRN